MWCLEQLSDVFLSCPNCNLLEKRNGILNLFDNLSLKYNYDWSNSKILYNNNLNRGYDDWEDVRFRVRRSGHLPALWHWASHRLLLASGFFLYKGRRMVITLQDWCKSCPRQCMGQLYGVHTYERLSFSSCFITCFSSHFLPFLYVLSTLQDIWCCPKHP